MIARNPIKVTLAAIAVLVAVVAVIVLDSYGYLPSGYYSGRPAISPTGYANESAPSSTAPDMDSYTIHRESGVTETCMAQDRTVDGSGWECVKWHAEGTIASTGEVVDMYADTRTGEVTNHVG